MDGAFEDAHNLRKKLTSYHSDKYKYHERTSLHTLIVLQIFSLALREGDPLESQLDQWAKL